jgi:hypothetical protein
MQNRIENEGFYQPDLGDFKPEPEIETFGIGSWKIGFAAEPKQKISGKIKMWLDCFGHKIPGVMLRCVLILIAMTAIWINGYATASRDFERDVVAGWYIKNATKFDEAAKNVITPGAWSPENEKETN